MPNGFGYSYIWALNQRQAGMIEVAGQALLKGESDARRQPVMYARSYDLEFNPVRGSAGKSVFIADGTMLRQRGKMLCILGNRSSLEDTPIYYLSQVRADQPIR